MLLAYVDCTARLGWFQSVFLAPTETKSAGKPCGEADGSLAHLLHTSGVP